MATLHYTITFHSYWHCGSGLAAGADVDALVVKDKNRLPFVPGKTMKGLVREALENILALNKTNKKDAVDKAFGYFGDKDDMSKGCMFFTNAELDENEQKAIISHKYQKHMYEGVSSTAIDKDGIACDHSLRRVEVTVPCVLHGCIKDVPQELSEDVLNALKMIKRMGVNRNRGLGRCTIEGKEEQI